MTLTDSLLAVLRKENQCTVEMVRLLGEVERTRHHLEEGFSCLLDYCVNALKLSRSSALKRINAARLSVRFPRVLSMLESREIHLSALVLLSRHLTEENHEELLSMAVGKSEREL